MKKLKVTYQSTSFEIDLKVMHYNDVENYIVCQSKRDNLMRLSGFVSDVLWRAHPMNIELTGSMNETRCINDVLCTSFQVNNNGVTRIELLRK